MKLKHPLVLAIFAYSVVGCPDGFVPWHEGYCYTVTAGDDYLYWNYAVHQCRAQGGQLASIHSALENKRIADALTTTGVGESWIGLQCLGVVSWIDRTVVDFDITENWDMCPDDSTSRAFTLSLNGVWTMYYMEDSGYAFYNGICRHRKRNGERCSDYDEVDGTGTCISIRTTPQTWWIAEDQCQQEGGHLLSIHDQRMDEHIRKRISNPEIVGTSGAFLIGMQTQASAKGETFTWSDGSSVNYTNFDTGYPADILGRCAAIQTTPGGKWISTQCDQSTLPYICSRPVNDPIQAAGCPVNPNFRDSGVILSPSYPASSGPLARCDYILTVAQGLRVNLVINDFNTNLCCDKLYLYDGLTSTTPFTTISGKSNQTSYATPTSNILKMTYTASDGTFVRGWKVTFKGV